MRNEPTLRIKLEKRGNPECSFCGTPFGSEGMARDLIDAFALHVRRQHLDAAVGSPSVREPLSRESVRAARRA
jgi:hypothetical protein